MDRTTIDPPAHRTPLRGRDRELGVLAARLSDLRVGRGAVVLVSGVPGSGKTRLLSEAAAMCRRAAVRVCVGAGDPTAQMIPFATLLDSLLAAEDPLLDARQLRKLAALPDARFWILEEIQERLEQAALTGSVVIAIDDLQWADDATLVAVRTLSRRLASLRILWLLSFRPDADVSALDAVRQAGADLLRLGSLEESAVAQISQDILGGVPDSALLALAAEAQGSPFLLTELLRGLSDEALIEHAGSEARLIGRRLPVRLRERIDRQLDRLSPPARDVVQLASLLPLRFTVDQLAALLERSAPTLIRPVGEALAAELLVEHGDALAFRHDLIREAVDASLPLSLRRALRRRALAVLVEQNASAAEIATLLLEVAEHGDRTAIDLLRRAAAELERTSPTVAADVIQRALDLAPEDHPDRPGMAVDAIRLLFRAGRAAEAHALAESALAGVLDPAAEASVRLQLAQLSVQYVYSDIVRHSLRALALPGIPDGLRLHLRVTLTLGHLMTGDIEEAREATFDDLAAARAAGDIAAEIAALNSCSAVLYRRHRFEEAIRYADEARAKAVGAGPAGQQLWPDLWAAWLRGLVGYVDDALQRAQDGLSAARREGRASDVRFWLMCRSTVLLTAGRLADARAEAEAVFEMIDDLGLGGAALNTAAFVLGRVALHTGDRRALDTAAAHAAMMRADDSINLRRNGEWLAALLADAAGDTTTAVAIVAETVSALGGLEPTLNSPQDSLEILLLLRLMLRAGRVDYAQTVVREIERRAALNPGFPLHAALAEHARGLLGQDVDAMRRSVGALDLLPGPVARAQLLEDAASVIVSVDRSQAVAHLDAALTEFDQAGAERDSARVRRQLRELGARRRRQTRADPASRYAGLTDSELAVVRLVAAGATNRAVAERLYLSPHTVSSHLRHVFEKLRINSRVELAAMFARRDGDVAADPSPSR